MDDGEQVRQEEHLYGAVVVEELREGEQKKRAEDVNLERNAEDRVPMRRGMHR